MENKVSKKDLGKKEKKLTEVQLRRRRRKQLRNLENFLRKLDYKKEELVHLENLKNILKPEYKEDELVSFDIESFFETLEEDWIKISEKSWKELFQYLINQFDEISYGRGSGLEWLISKIAWDLYIKFEKTISQGQAEAVIKRVLDIKLSSTGRTQLYELRKKIRRYEKFINYFGDWAQTYDFTLKIVIMGLNPAQTTKLLPIAPLPEIKGSRSTLGVEFYLKPIEIYNKRVKLSIWDISVEERHRSRIDLYCEGAHGAILVYDKSDRESFELVKEFYTELNKATNLKFEIKERKGAFVGIPITLIGLGDGKNVAAEEGQSLAKELSAYSYIEISETDTENFENILSSLSLGIITNYQDALKRYPRKFRFKVTVVGDVEVGKTSLIKQYTKSSFNKDYVKTIGGQYSVYDKEVQGDKVRCLFWDIAGGESFQFLHQSFFKNSRVAIIVYSLEEDNQDRNNFNQISDWHERIIRFCGDIPIVIIANKIDLTDETKLNNSQILEFVNENNVFGYFITSAKTGQGVDEAFNSIIDEMYKLYNKQSKEFL